ncbi:MAG: hypothetical protein HND51_13655 [Chloroflexi bacterium]|nr:hypothetical protein [Chloroflexota bacterium]
MADKAVSTFSRIGMVARWRPVHLGHTPVLRALCQTAEKALIGIGSSNTYDYRNPFTLEETKDMLRLALVDYNNYTFIAVPDLFDGPRWRDMVQELFGDLDVYVTENPYVTDLMKGIYNVIKPVELVPDDEKIPLNGTMVRQAMARGEDWQAMVPPEIASYIENKGLDERFRTEFGLETLAKQTMTSH